MCTLKLFSLIYDRIYLANLFNAFGHRFLVPSCDKSKLMEDSGGVGGGWGNVGFRGVWWGGGGWWGFKPRGVYEVFGVLKFGGIGGVWGSMGFFED